MKKLALALMLAVGLTACDKKETLAPEGKPTIKIGVNLPLSGDMAFAGENMKKSLDMALNDASKKDLKYNYELILEDNVFENKKTNLNLNKFKSLDKVNALMSFHGSAGILSGIFAEQNKLPHIGCSLSGKAGDGFYNFNHSTKPTTHMKAVIDFYNQNGYKKVALIYNSMLEVEEFINEFKPFLEQNGFEIVFSEALNPGEKDLRLLITKAKSTNPDTAFVLLVPPTLNVFGKQRKELKLDIPLASVNVFSFAPEVYENEIYFTEDSGTDVFINKYKKYSDLEAMSCTVNFYDGLNMFIDAYENVGDGKSIPKSNLIVEYMLNNKNFDSQLEGISIDKEGNIDSASVKMTIKNGKPVLVEEK